MESTFKELEVITHSDFLINAQDIFKDIENIRRRNLFDYKVKKNIKNP